MICQTHTLTDRQTDRQTHFLFIDGLKGLACIMIMIGHYIGIVKYSQDITCFPFITWLNRSVLHTIIDEGLWLQLFFVISGFLLSFAEIDCVISLIKRIVKRFLRFYLPILAACFLIFILSKTIGFHNKETVTLFSCQWYQSFYSGNIKVFDIVIDPLKTVLIGGSKFNSPFWVIKNMFLSSVLIYAINFLTNKLGNKRSFIVFIYMLVTPVSEAVFSPVLSACLTGGLCGVLLKRYKKYIEKIPQVGNGILCILCTLLPFGMHTVLFHLIAKCFEMVGITVRIMRYLEFRSSTWGVLYFALLILLLSSNKTMQTPLSCKALCMLNQISFGVYSFHWPLICSIGALLMMAISTKNGMIVAWIACIAITIVVSIFYYSVFEKNINRLLKRIL